MNTSTVDQTTSQIEASTSGTIIVTRLSRISQGWPITWLYSWELAPAPGGDVLVLFFTGHQVTLRGARLDEVACALESLRPLRLVEQGERYAGLEPERGAYITSVEITALV